MREPRSVAIVLAAGAGRRLGEGEPKAFRSIGGRPILSVAAASAAASPAVGELVVAAPEGSLDRARSCVEGLVKPVRVVAGGATRQDSVRESLAELPEGTESVAVHDGARPFAPPELFTAVLSAVAGGATGAIPVVAATDTVKRVRNGRVVGTQAREELALAQTPQGFRLEAIRDSLDRAAAAQMDFTDDAAALEWAGYDVVAVAGDPVNFKITSYADLARADRRMARDRPEALARVGSGFDVHRFDPGRPLWLGGLLFPGEPGLVGHSDGDAVCHAVADAFLGAASLGDVGQHFPDTDPSIAGISGGDLLSRTVEIVRGAGFSPSSVDVTIICDRPAIAPRREEIRARLASIARLEVESVSVKATRPEGLGLSGDGVGCLATAVVG
jgi:2-C-methyl-D-erythritol 4-phosphate cytidylyltransferase / 2-C-methyl-D-erythritol 2,4-cyclodiphosphate synthase